MFIVRSLPCVWEHAGELEKWLVTQNVLEGKFAYIEPLPRLKIWLNWTFTLIEPSVGVGS